MVSWYYQQLWQLHLTEMRDKGRLFADVLADAQQLGYAEADPTFDVEGIDAAHKLAILASLAFAIHLILMPVLLRNFCCGPARC